MEPVILEHCGTWVWGAAKDTTGGWRTAVVDILPTDADRPGALHDRIAKYVLDIEQHDRGVADRFEAFKANLARMKGNQPEYVI